MNDELILDDVKYISVKRAAEITQYSRDYIGQLCREGKILANRIGRNWYVAEKSIIRHKTENSADTPFVPQAASEQSADTQQPDLLSKKEEEKIQSYPRPRKRVYTEPARQPARLAADAAASKWARSAGASRRLAGGPLATYYSDDRPLLPQLEKKEVEDKNESTGENEGNTVPINVIDERANVPTRYIDKKPAISDSGSFTRALIVIMLFVVFIELFTISTHYAHKMWSGSRPFTVGSALTAFDQAAWLVNTTVDDTIYNYLYASLLED